ncbi:Zn-ribbon domain-containing OB-fold protein [Oryzicola mucosus]|uniref:OB-fold domain-containing protein n=1 Tax=Oryzicola mucosus TaxID=2767425 RepID=A0A8J6PNH2_9HYPH|nr:OB-fold domain-containing protein [Oryzicola mucosus]MBD0416736.1 OB-fold domain-containing protein [Oryzicola mucosus]
MDQIRPDQDFEAFLAEGRFMIQRSRSSGNHVFYPRVAEPRTGSRDLEWVEASGDGVVYAVTVVHKRPPEKDYNVVLVDLAEGPRMMSRVDGIAPDAVKIGMPVKAGIVTEDGRSFVVFTPVTGALA